MIPKILKNFNLFVTGRGYAGLVEEVTLPVLKIHTEEMRTGGMDIPVAVDMGMEALTCELSFNEYDPLLFKLFGLTSRAFTTIELRGAIMDEDGNAVAVIVTIRGAWTQLDMGSWKAGEIAKLKVSVAVRKYILSIGGEDLIEIDPDNLVRRIDGVDQLSALQTALSMGDNEVTTTMDNASGAVDNANNDAIDAGAGA